MTPLREKMIKAMEMRNFAKNTQRGYLGAVKGLASFHRQSPDTLTKDQIEDYLLYLKNGKGNTTGSSGAVAAGLRFFYTHVVENPFVLMLCFAAAISDSSNNRFIPATAQNFGIRNGSAQTIDLNIRISEASSGPGSSWKSSPRPFLCGK